MKWTLTFEGERGGEGGWYCPAYNHDYECCEHKDSPAKDKPCPGLGNEGCPAVPAPEPGKVVEPWVAVSERLPEQTGEYLCVSTEHKVGFINWDANKRTWWGGMWEITHWMPLPPAPEDGK